MQGEESRRESDDEFLDDDEDGAADPQDLYLQNGDQDDSFADDEEIENDMPHVAYCSQCGDQIEWTQQMCLFCTHTAMRGAGAPLGMMR